MAKNMEAADLHRMASVRHILEIKGRHPVNTPKHQQDTTEPPHHVLPVSTPDTPIYDGLVHETYGGQGGPLVDRQPPKVTPTEPPTVWSTSEPTDPILGRVLAALNREAPTRAPDGQVSGELPTGAAPGVSGELPTRIPGSQLDARLRQPHGQHRPQVPDARCPVNRWFQEPEPAQASCGGGR
jgi:hypothetical protein